jgi:hypothetical protein
MQKYILFLCITYSLISCQVGQQEQSICSSKTNGVNTAKLCMKSNNCLHLLPNSTCQVELDYYSTYQNTVGPSPAIYNELSQNYFWVTSPSQFDVQNTKCPIPQANKQTCVLNITYTGNSNITSPFSGKLNIIVPNTTESDIITTITINGTNN